MLVGPDILHQPDLHLFSPLQSPWTRTSRGHLRPYSPKKTPPRATRMGFSLQRAAREILASPVASTGWDGQKHSNSEGRRGLKAAHPQPSIPPWLHDRARLSKRGPGRSPTTLPLLRARHFLRPTLPRCHGGRAPAASRDGAGRGGREAGKGGGGGSGHVAPPPPRASGARRRRRGHGAGGGAMPPPPAGRRRGE